MSGIFARVKLRGEGGSPIHVEGLGLIGFGQCWEVTLPRAGWTRQGVTASRVELLADAVPSVGLQHEPDPFAPLTTEQAAQSMSALDLEKAADELLRSKPSSFFAEKAPLELVAEVRRDQENAKLAAKRLQAEQDLAELRRLLRTQTEERARVAEAQARAAREAAEQALIASQRLTLEEAAEAHAKAIATLTELEAKGDTKRGNVARQTVADAEKKLADARRDRDKFEALRALAPATDALNRSLQTTYVERHNDQRVVDEPRDIFRHKHHDEMRELHSEAVRALEAEEFGKAQECAAEILRLWRDVPTGHLDRKPGEVFALSSFDGVALSMATGAIGGAE